MTFDHSGRTVFVTGAGSGIGRATCLRLASEGANVCATDTDVRLAEATAAAVEERGGKVLALHVDVRDRQQIRQAVDDAQAHFGGVHLLVNNAGLITTGSFATLQEEEWDLVLDVNLKGQWLVAQEVAPAIRAAGGGAMVNLSTVESLVVVTSTGTTQPHYNASKGGVTMLTKAMAIELAPDIRVNAVAPGPVATDFFDLQAVTSEEGMAFMSQRLLIPRVAQPEDIAAPISFLLSDEAAYITGIQLPVDGGWLTR